MPSPKMGTVTNNVAQAVHAAKAGAVRFKVDKKGIVHAGIGKVSFTREKLLDNIRAFMIAVFDVKPEGMKNKYLKVAHICSSMGPGINLEVPSVDPSSARFMLKL
jgi:large subunit ribosomal protein L1